MVDRLADPLLSGVYGGEATSLSVRAVLPRFSEMERTHGSLGRAMLAVKKKTARPTGHHPTPPLFTSLKNGMEQLVAALVARLSPGALLTGTPVQSIRPEGARWKISAGVKSDHFDAVIVAVPPYAAAQLLETCSPALAAELASIAYTSPLPVALGYESDVRQP